MQTGPNLEHLDFVFGICFESRASDFELVLTGHESVPASVGLTEPDRKNSHAPVGHIDSDPHGLQAHRTLALLVAQGDHRVDPCGPAGGKVAGQQRGDTEQHDGRSDARGIDGIDPAQNAGDHMGDSQSQEHSRE